MRIAFEPRAEKHNNQVLRKAALAVGTTAVRFAFLFAATEALITSGALLTDARVFNGTLAMSQAKDALTPKDLIVGSALAAAQVGAFAFVDHVSREGLREGDADIWEHPVFHKHSGTIATAAATTLWLGMAAGTTALAFAIA